MDRNKQSIGARKQGIEYCYIIIVQFHTGRELEIGECHYRTVQARVVTAS
jgi:hypothetical protein